MPHRLDQRERGQSAVIVAVLLVVMFGLLAFTFDATNAYFKRRLAQTAADAGALAGARILCETHSTTAAADTAYEYAVTHNVASAADVLATTSMVTVTTTIDFPTTFANIFGVAEMTAGATASSGCFVPSQPQRILPVGYSCKDGILADDDGGGLYCSFIDYDRTFIIMDSEKLPEDAKCMSEGGSVDCDWNNDGIDDRLAGGERSWIDLNGQEQGSPGGASQLCGWIQNGFAGGARVHDWYAALGGVTASTFDCANAILNQQIFLPVYNIISTSPSSLVFDDPSDRVVWATGASRKYLHIISFAVFVPTCVHRGGSDSCPVYDGFRSAGILGPSVKTIEGHFTTGFVSGTPGVPGGVFAGAYTLYLTR
jgi:hypothetical protein